MADHIRYSRIKNQGEVYFNDPPVHGQLEFPPWPIRFTDFFGFLSSNHGSI
jgi:hypothetical protein